MDKSLERSGRDKVIRRTAKAMADFGFRRGRSTFFIREQPHVIEFIHLHKFSFMTGFRVHAGIRVLQDSFDAPALNGPDSDPVAPKYSADPSSVDLCVSHIVAWYRAVAAPWFERWRDVDLLLRDSSSPLDATSRDALAAALRGQVNIEAEKLSRQMLGAG